MKSGEIEAKDNLKCICKGNWRTIIAECEHLIGKSFKDKDGNNYHFFGVVHGEDDYYYGMSSKYTKSIHLLSCVGSLETSGFELIEEQ